MESKYYIGYSSDTDIRFKSSSGGVGTAIIKYLLSLPEYGTAMTFLFNKEKCAYEPKLIYSFDEYNCCGSIYQDFDNIGFVKRNMDKIIGGIIVTCMPCQVRAIRNILNRHHINSFIISLCCSCQTIVEGTWCYYKFLGIDKKQVVNVQYRGNGWPSGIQITLEDGTVVKRANWSYPWTVMYSSLLFRPKRCLGCRHKTVSEADVNLADPWLKEYEDDDVTGNSIVILNTEESAKVYYEMLANDLVVSKQVDEETYIKSQKGTIEEKKKVIEHKKFYKAIWKLSTSSLYIRVATHSLKMLKLHNLLKLYLYRLLK